MSVVELEKLFFDLPADEHAKLADRVIELLPEDFIDDEEMELALRRDAEMDEGFSATITHIAFFEDNL